MRSKLRGVLRAVRINRNSARIPRNSQISGRAPADYLQTTCKGSPEITEMLPPVRVLIRPHPYGSGRVVAGYLRS